MPELIAEIALQDGKVIFLNKVPGKIKRQIRKRFKEDEQFRNEIIKQCGAKQS